MYTTNLALAGKYAYLTPKFEQVFAFLNSQDLAALPLGRIELDGKDIFINVQSYDTTPDSKYESHKNYFDLQLVVEGEERFAYAPIDRLTLATEYNPVKDVMFYQWPEEPQAELVLRAGDFALVAPEDAHAPHLMTNGTPGPVKKIVVKVHL